LHQELVFQPEHRGTDFQAISLQNTAGPIPGGDRNDKSLPGIVAPVMEGLSKAEFAQILMATSACLHFEPKFMIKRPLLLIVGDKDITGNIRKVMPIWARHEPDYRFVVIPNAKHAANLDDPALFHKTVMDFLARFANNS
jgi:pimeloyl-ACP methyl ester carboxylesterase